MPNEIATYKIDERVLVLAPVGRDAQLTCQKLGELGLTVETCHDMQELCDTFAKGAGAAFITEEALTPDAVSCLVTALQHQPPWSDFPVIVLTSDRVNSSKLNTANKLTAAGNVTLVERPESLHF